MLTARGPRGTTLVGLVLGGVVLGLVGGAVSSLRRTIGGIDLPWGVVLALLAVACCVRGAAWLVGTRRGAAAVSIGWIGATIALAALSPGGDVLLPDQPRTYLYLTGGVFVSLLASLWPLPEGAADAAYPAYDVPVDDHDTGASTDEQPAQHSGSGPVAEAGPTGGQ